MSAKDKIFDPFCKDSAKMAGGKCEKSNFNPSVSPFTPSTDLTSWEVVAAEYTGKAVAVMQKAGENKLLVCTSPAFNSKCRHPGISCLDWDNVRLAPAQGSQPDSGLDNTDQGSEERDRIARVAQWSADAARQTEAAKGEEWSESILADSGLSPVWGGETQFVQWSPVSGQSVEQQYSNLEITVEYHTPHHTPHSALDHTLNHTPDHTASTRTGCGNDPLFVCPSQAVTDDSWACGLGLDFSAIGLQSYPAAGQDRSLADISQDDLAEQERVREEFKNKILSNIGIKTKQTEESRKREEFKKQILSRSKQKSATELSVNCDTVPAVPDNDKEERIRNDFKNKILSNLNSGK